MVYTYVKGGTGEYAVANKVVVYAYNMWYPLHVQCMYMYIHHMYTYVQVCAMYVHGLISCLNSHP
jgi:hypothetical protein